MRVWWWTGGVAVVGLLACRLPAWGDLKCTLDSPAAVRAGGGTIEGAPRFLGAPEGPGVLLGSQGYLAFPTGDHFDPNQGSIALRVQPRWRGDDGEDHTFFHLGGADVHCTLFKTAAGSLRFVYKAAPPLWAACDLDVSDWQPGEWHRIQASWLPTYSGELLLLLDVDGQRVIQSGARPLPQVAERFFLGRRGPELQPAEASLSSFELSSTPARSPYPVSPKPPVEAVIDASRARQAHRVHDFTTIWNSRANPLPFQVGDATFRRFVEAGFRMARLVAFSESWLWGVRVEVDPQGQLQTDFSDFDRLLDTVLAAGAEPYIRLAYHTPSALVDPALPRERRSYALPHDLEQWDELMERIVRHVRVEWQLPVRYWVAALNEGDLPVRQGWADFDTVNRLYERTAGIVRRIDPAARVGGPALAWSTGDRGEALLRSFLRYCRDRDLPLDFLCFHAYRRPHPRDFETEIDTIRRIAREEWPQRAERLEYFLDEWNLWLRDGRQDNEYGAAYLAAALHYQRRAGLTRSSIVSFNHFLPTEIPARDLARHRGPFPKPDSDVARFLARDLTCGGETRPGILAHPPNGEGRYTYGAYPVRVPDRGQTVLRFATGIANEYPACDGCGFAVVVRAGEEDHELWRVFQPSRAWIDREVDLSDWAGQEIILELRTDSGPRANTAGDWAAWGEPCLQTEGTEDGDETILDLAEAIDQAQTGARQSAWHFVYNDDTIHRYTGLPLIKGPVVTAPYFVWVMHHRLGERELAVELPGRDGILDDDSGGLTATRGEDRIALLLWHFDLLRNQPRSWTIRVTELPQPLRRAAALQLTEYRIDHDHTNPYTRYVVNQEGTANGRYNLETAQLEVLRTAQVRVQDGEAILQVELPNLSVALVELTVADGAAGG